MYIPNSKSKVLAHEDIDYFELLELDVARYKSLGRILICGDLNSRTGTHSRTLEIPHTDNYIPNNTDDDTLFTHIPQRVSEDHVVDRNGRKLLAMCQTTGLCIGNGRLAVDANVGKIHFVPKWRKCR